MTPSNRKALEGRVVAAAEAALRAKYAVSAVDVLLGTGALSLDDFSAWRKGRIPFLESVVNMNLKRISCAMSMFRKWAVSRGLKPSETAYVRYGRGPKRELRFSKYGNANVERLYRTHYVPALAEQKKQRL